jgi:hypothetical protein
MLLKSETPDGRLATLASKAEFKGKPPERSPWGLYETEITEIKYTDFIETFASLKSRS